MLVHEWDRRLLDFSFCPFSFSTFSSHLSICDWVKMKSVSQSVSLNLNNLSTQMLMIYWAAMSVVFPLRHWLYSQLFSSCERCELTTAATYDCVLSLLLFSVAFAPAAQFQWKASFSRFLIHEKEEPLLAGSGKCVPGEDCCSSFSAFFFGGSGNRRYILGGQIFICWQRGRGLLVFFSVFTHGQRPSLVPSFSVSSLLSLAVVCLRAQICEVSQRALFNH